MSHLISTNSLLIFSLIDYNAYTLPIYGRLWNRCRSFKSCTFLTLFWIQTNLSIFKLLIIWIYPTMPQELSLFVWIRISLPPFVLTFKTQIIRIFKVWSFKSINLPPITLHPFQTSTSPWLQGPGYWGALAFYAYFLPEQVLFFKSPSFLSRSDPSCLKLSVNSLSH